MCIHKRFKMPVHCYSFFFELHLHFCLCKVSLKGALSVKSIFRRREIHLVVMVETNAVSYIIYYITILLYYSILPFPLNFCLIWTHQTRSKCHPSVLPVTRHLPTMETEGEAITCLLQEFSLRSYCDTFSITTVPWRQRHTPSMELQELHEIKTTLWKHFSMFMYSVSIENMVWLDKFDVEEDLDPPSDSMLLRHMLT